jgi:hypothetical protein
VVDLIMFCIRVWSWQEGHSQGVRRLHTKCQGEEPLNVPMGNGTAAISGHRNHYNFRAGHSNYIYSQFYLFYITIFMNYTEFIHVSSHSKIPCALF